MASLFQQTVDDALLNQALQGERAAQAKLFSLFGRPVYTLACRLLVDRQLAEDVLQDTFVEVLRNLGDFAATLPWACGSGASPSIDAWRICARPGGGCAGSCRMRMRRISSLRLNTTGTCWICSARWRSCRRRRGRWLAA